MSEILLKRFINQVISGVSVYINVQYIRYEASRDQAQKVSRVMEDVRTGTAGLFSQKKPWLEMKP